MNNIVGIRFKRAGKVYYFDPGDIELEVNDYVVVDTSQGLETGRVVIAPRQVMANEMTDPLRPVVRKAEPADVERAEELEAKAEEALIECGKLIGELQLQMKLLSAGYNFDGNHLTFLFSAEQRVDFRELVKRLTSRLKTRVELRQVGSRDEAKLIGGYGRCGRNLCCCSFLSEFSPVSIKMAKEQDLPLNPIKISGACGRLMCCLGYESKQYRNMKKKLPKVGLRVATPTGDATVASCNLLKETVFVALESGATVELPLNDISY